MDLTIETLGGSGPGGAPLEIVERKGLGHPDTICDAIAEEVCRALCREYERRFGGILHHNVDKVLLCGGAARPVFGGGELTSPIEIILGGRATREHQGEVVPIDEIAIEAAREWVRRSLPNLDADRQVTFASRIHPGSSELGALFKRSRGAEVPRANDTSIGVGFAPRTLLERVVMEVEQLLNAPETKRTHPHVGEDVKVMGLRSGGDIDLTVACAIVSRHVHDLDAYAMKVEIVRELVEARAEALAGRPVNVTVNAADDLDGGDVYLTVTGTSAEAGDDGEVGRGNRASGLITPYRPMTMEAAAGKNPVSHVGKLYNVLAGRTADRLAAEIEGAKDASIVIVSRIGHRIDDPRAVDVHLAGAAQGADEVGRAVRAIVCEELQGLDALRASLIAGRERLF